MPLSIFFFLLCAEIEVEDVEAGVSGMAVFFCNVTGSTGLTGGVDIQYNWTTVRNGVSPRDGFPNTHFEGRERSDGINPILTIFNVSQDDDDFNYTCVVRDLSRMGQVVGNATATLTAVGKISLSLSLSLTHTLSLSLSNTPIRLVFFFSILIILRVQCKLLCECASS